MSGDTPSLSIRIDLPGGGRFGPGKAALMGAIKAEGSIASAARTLGMSYPRALKLIDSMNTQFVSPLIETHQGGADRGGATVTETGLQVLALYEQLLKASQDANVDTLAAMTQLSTATKPFK